MTWQYYGAATMVEAKQAGGLMNLMIDVGRRIILSLTTLCFAASCSLPIPLPPKEEFDFDGVVHRLPIKAKGIATGHGPYCGEEPLEVGKKGRSGYRPAPGYRIGPGDDLKLNIFGETGMTNVIARVDADGYVQLPIIETTWVGGLNTREIHADLKRRYADHFRDPWITVELANAESHPVYFLGEFRSPGVKYLERATDLLAALSFAEGMEEDAYLPGARLLRDNKACTVDIYALLREGRFDQNVWVAPHDAIFMPSRNDMQVYVIGAVGSPQSVPFSENGRTLLQTLSEVGGPIRGKAILSEIRVIRSFSPTEGELIVVNVEKMLAGKNLDFPLEPNDVVYVPQSIISDWNNAISEILPSLQLIGGILTPFTIVKALQE